MRINLIVFLVFTSRLVFAQDKMEYLSQNRVDLRIEKPNITETDFNIIGFSAAHGSSKPYEAELQLVQSLLEKDKLDYYIIETNFSQAFFLQKYLETGDEKLLKELTYGFQTIVSQEGTIDTYNHWKNIYKLLQKYPEKSIKIIGCDIVYEYRKHLLLLSEDDGDWTQRKILEEAISQENLNFTIWNKELHKKVKAFVQDYLDNKKKYAIQIDDIWTFDHIIQTINYNFQERREREKIIFDNYLALKAKLGLEKEKQFVKYGYFHIQKHRIGDYTYFFTRLIENNIYKRENVITIIGYLTKSKVLWDKKYDKNGNYKGYTTRAGYGISDYWKEYFKGIKNLKKSKLSDLTMFKLNQEDSPYTNGTDLVEIKMFLKDYNTTKLKGKNTLQFFDYAILISNSKEQVPIEEMK